MRLIPALIRRWLIYRDPIGYARKVGVKIGLDCRLIGLTPGTFGTEPYLVELGNHVTITRGVQFVTHDGGVWVFRQQHPNWDVVAPITVEDNVFVGMGSIILPGVTIGSNCVVGAGSIVARDIPSGCVAAGVPARLIKSIEQYYAEVSQAAIDSRSLSAEEKRMRFSTLAAMHRSRRHRVSASSESL